MFLAIIRKRIEIHFLIGFGLKTLFWSVTSSNPASDIDNFCRSVSTLNEGRGLVSLDEQKMTVAPPTNQTKPYLSDSSSYNQCVKIVFFTLQESLTCVLMFYELTTLTHLKNFYVYQSGIAVFLDLKIFYNPREKIVFRT